MTVRNLEHVFTPRSVVVIGASAEPRSVGNRLTENVMAGGFVGEIYLVNPHQELISRRRCFPDIAALPVAPELAVMPGHAAKDRAVADRCARQEGDACSRRDNCRSWGRA